jgi:hypothetical protein
LKTVLQHIVMPQAGLLKKTHVPQIAPRTLARALQGLSTRQSMNVKINVKGLALHLIKMMKMVKMITRIAREIAKRSVTAVALTTERK